MRRSATDVTVSISRGLAQATSILNGLYMSGSIF